MSEDVFEARVQDRLMKAYGFEVEASNHAEAFIKLYRYVLGQPCTCGLPDSVQASDGQDVCVCVVVSISERSK